MSQVVTVAIAQAAPAYLDIEGSTDRAVELLAEAAAAGAKLVAMGETWLPGYPAWLDEAPSAALWDHEPTKAVFARLRRNSPTVPGPHVQRIADAARQHGVAVVIGINERVDGGPGHGTLFNTLLTLDERGTIVQHHRKLVPTYTEKLVWGPGDAAGLTTARTQAGRVGGLICWEHWMPLARQAMHDAGEDIHVALWPTVHDKHQLASRHYAFEGRCHVLAVGTLLRAEDVPPELPLRDGAGSNGWLVRGGSAIIDPRGEYVVEPVFEEERLIVAEIDLERNDRERMTLDVSGHYGRPDVLHFDIDRRRRRADAED